MKYCKKCGTLLEEAHEHCIRCGADVTLPENVSPYPVRVMETLDAEKEQKKKTGKIVAMIIILIVLLMVGIFGAIYFAGRKAAPIGNLTNKSKEKTVAETEAGEDASQEDVSNKPAQTDDASGDATTKEAEVSQTEEKSESETENAASTERAISDSKGNYYNLIKEYDDTDKLIFTAIVPEDLTQTEFYKDYSAYSTVFPIGINFTAYNEDNSVRFTYLSPKQLWYKKSETGKTLDDVADLMTYMTYCVYESPTSYLEKILKQNYPGAKMEIVNEYDINEKLPSAIEEMAAAKSRELFKNTDDYAGIGSGTKYTNMDYSSSAKVYEYEITLKDKTVLLCKYYVPAMAHNLMYANQDTNDRGTVTEWYNFGITCFETGNDDLYDEYSEAFDVFAANAMPTDLFMYYLDAYGSEITDSILESREVPKLSKAMLKKYASEYTGADKLSDFGKNVSEFMKLIGDKSFSGEDGSVYTYSESEAVYVDNEKGKVFISPDGEEYPGSEYEQYTVK